MTQNSDTHTHLLNHWLGDSETIEGPVKFPDLTSLNFVVLLES